MSINEQLIEVVVALEDQYALVRLVTPRLKLVGHLRKAEEESMRFSREDHRRLNMPEPKLARV